MGMIGNTPYQGQVGSGNIQDGGVQPIDLSTGRPFWTTDGKLGIGTDTPRGKLDVQGGDVFISNTGESFNFIERLSAGAPNNWIGSWTFRAKDAASNLVNYAKIYALQIDTTTGGQSGKLFLSATKANSQTNYIVLDGLSDIIQLQTGNTERVRINSLGDVGIGTSTPNARLELRTTSGENLRLTKSTGASISWHDETQVRAHISGLNGTDGLAIFTGSAFTERFRIDSSGNVGIGTSSPSSRLTVKTSATDLALNLGTGTNANNQDINFLNSADGISGKIRYYPDTGTMSLWTNSSERMRIASNGDVSIGSSVSISNTLRYFDIYNTDTGTNSGAIFRLITTKVDNSGTTAVDFIKYKNYGFYINNNEPDATNATIFGVAGAERMRISANGNVGIGAGLPAQRLHIVGNQQLIRLNTTASTSSTMNANSLNSVIGISAPFGDNPASVSNLNAKWGITFTGNGDAPTSIGGTKSASVLAVSEDSWAGYNRAVGLAFYTSSFDAVQAERMRLDSTGSLTLAKQPLAYGTFYSGARAVNELVPMYVTYDNTSMFTSATRLTIPVAGRYQITASLLINPAGSYTYFAVTVNGGVHYHAHANVFAVSGTENLDHRINIIRNLAAGDYIEFKIAHVSIDNAWGDTHSCWSCAKVS